MDQKFILINNRINRQLQLALIAYDSMVMNGRKDLADFILLTASKIAYNEIRSTGLQAELTKFWNDKKALVNNDLI